MLYIWHIPHVKVRVTIWRVRARVLSVMWVTIWYLYISRAASEENPRVSALPEIRPAPSFDCQAVVFKKVTESMASVFRQIPSLVHSHLERLKV